MTVTTPQSMSEAFACPPLSVVGAFHYQGPAVPHRGEIERGVRGYAERVITDDRHVGLAPRLGPIGGSQPTRGGFELAE